MSDNLTPWYKIVQTLWPAFMFLTVILVWMIQLQTVSNTSFTELQTRVTIVEEQTPSKTTMVKMEADIAVIKSQLSALNKNVDIVLKKIIKE